MSQIILIAEDDEDLRYTIHRDLVDRFDVTVVEAECGQRAYEIIAKGLRPDVLISDFKMPNMNGFELAKALQELCYVPPMIFMTGLDPRSLVKQAFALGSFEFVSKPLEESFYEAVSNALALARLNWTDAESEPRQRKTGS